MYILLFIILYEKRCSSSIVVLMLFFYAVLSSPPPLYLHTFVYTISFLYLNISWICHLELSPPCTSTHPLVTSVLMNSFSNSRKYHSLLRDIEPYPRNVIWWICTPFQSLSPTPHNLLSGIQKKTNVKWISSIVLHRYFKKLFSVFVLLNSCKPEEGRETKAFRE